MSEVFLVGGAVRDKLLGLSVKEKDWVVVGSTEKDLLNQGYLQVGKDFPVFLHPETKEEYALARKEKKIGAIGLRVSKWITYHGLSFNINPDMKYYDNINACGLKNYKNTSLKELNVDINYKEFDKKFSQIFLKNLFKI